MLKYLSISCEKATALVEVKNAFGLSIWNRYRLHLHQKVCVMCKQYEDQSKLMDAYLKKSVEQRKTTKIDMDKAKEQVLAKLK
jgi:hypothetical protein